MIMANKTLADEIITIVNSEANNNPVPIRCTITRVYEDNKHTDIETDNDRLTYVETIGNNLAVNNIGVLFVLEDENFIVMTK